MTVKRSRTFASLLKRHRDAAGLTQEELAGRAGAGRAHDQQPRARHQQGALPRHRPPPRRCPGTLRRGSRPARGFRPPPPEALLARRPDGGRRRLPRRGADSTSGSPRARAGTNPGRSGGGRRRLGAAGAPGRGAGHREDEAGPGGQRTRQGGGFLVASGRCYEAQSGVPFYPFLEALGTLYEDAPRKVREEIPERWPYLARLLPDHFPLAASGEPRGGATASPGGDRLRARGLHRAARCPLSRRSAPRRRRERGPPGAPVQAYARRPGSTSGDLPRRGGRTGASPSQSRTRTRPRAARRKGRGPQVGARRDCRADERQVTRGRGIRRVLEAGFRSHRGQPLLHGRGLESPHRTR